MIYFTRHGESEANIQKVFANKCFNYFLTNKGIEQAVALSKKLKDKNITSIYVRFEKFIRGIKNKAAHENVLVISHGGLLKIGLPEVVSNMDYFFTNNNPLGNCDLVSCKCENEKITCIQYGNIDYLRYEIPE